MLQDWYAYATHCIIWGTSQSGKSKFSEHCIREHILSGNGACLIDWHGTMYRDLLGFLAFTQPNRRIVILDPSGSGHVVPFNPFALPAGREPSAHVNRLASTIVKPWGDRNTNELPTYERIVKMVLEFMAVTGEPIHHAAKLLEFPKKEVREYAISKVENDYVKQQWKVLQYVRNLKEWNSHVLSTQNRLGRFLSSRSIIRFMGLQGEALSIADCIREKAIVLVNLRPSNFLDPESGRVFAALLLSEFLDAGIMNMGEPQPYFLYLDECQNYLTDDAAPMLDQVLKSGLRLSLIHHHGGQFHDKPHLQQSIETNAKLRVVFAGLPLHEAKRMAEEFFLSEANERWCKETAYGYHTEYSEEPYFTETSSVGSSSSHGSVGESETASSSESSSSTSSWSSRIVPRSVQERTGQEDWGREEKVAKLAERLLSLTRGECYVRTPANAYRYAVPWVEDYGSLLDPAKVLRYEESLLTNATPSHEADQILREAEARFLARGKDYEAGRKARPAKKRALSPQQ